MGDSDTTRPVELPPELYWLEPLSAAYPSSCNSFAVRENDGTWTWIDPGSAGEDNIARTGSELARHDLDLDDLGRILITHPHMDHLSAAAVLAEQGFDVPVLCHPDAVACAENIDVMMASFDFDLATARFPNERERVEAVIAVTKRNVFHGGSPFRVTSPRGSLYDGLVVDTGPFSWTCIDTPGHCPGHMSFYCESHGLLVTGDVIGHSLAWHSPSSGGASGYMSSLDRMDGLDVQIVLPSHGPPSYEWKGLHAKMRSRLAQRESRVVDALAGGPKPYADVYDAVMRDPAKKRLFPFVPMLEGHLERLKAGAHIDEREGLLHRL